MRLLFITSLLITGLYAGCKKEAEETPDYSKTIFESNPGWERVSIVPWQEPYEGERDHWYILGDLQFSPTGELLFAFAQRNEDAMLHGTPSTAYLATTTMGGDGMASVAHAGFTIKANEDAVQFFQQPSERKVFACLASPGTLKLLRPDGLAATAMGMNLSDYVQQRLINADSGPRYLPRYHPGSGDLLFNNDQFGSFYTTELYNTGTNSWLEANNPATSRAGNDWVSYQTSDAMTGYCELQVGRDSVYLTVYQLDNSTRTFDSLSTIVLPEFSARGIAGNCRILSYNDEDGLVVAVARYESNKPLEASVYKKAIGNSRFDALYQSVSLPAASSASHLQRWGFRESATYGASACTPDGTLFDLTQDATYYYLITVDATGIHEKTRFTPGGRGRLHHWPMAFLKGSFYLLADNLIASTETKDLRLEILRVK